MADAKDDEDKVEDLWKKIKRLKKKKIYKKYLLKAEKKARLKAKEANDKKEAGDNKDASFLTLNIAISSGFSSPHYYLFQSFFPCCCLSQFFDLCLYHSQPCSCYLRFRFCSFFFFFLFYLIFSFFFSHPPYYFYFLLSMQVYRSTSLQLKDDYATQHPVSLLKTSKKQLQLNIDKDNRKKL